MCVIAVFLHYYQSKGLVSNDFIEFICDWLKMHFNPLIAVLFEKNLSSKKKKKKKMNIVGFEPEAPDCKLSALPT